MPGSDSSGEQPSVSSAGQGQQSLDEVIDSIGDNGVDLDYPHPKDGYRVELYLDSATNTLQLAMHLFHGGEVRTTWLLGEWENPTPAEIGVCTRRAWLFEPISQFLNSGGTVEELRSSVFDFTKGLSLIEGEDAPGDVQVLEPPCDVGMPEGFDLLTIEQLDGANDEPVRCEYVFGDVIRDEAIVWVEDVDFQKMRLSDLSFNISMMTLALDKARQS